MRTIETIVYKFDELSEAAQQRAIGDSRDKNTDSLHFFSDDCIEQIKEAGFYEPKLQYSLSYCQGDGLSFSAHSYEKLKGIFSNILGDGKEKTAGFLAEKCHAEIKGNNGRYCFASRSDIDLYIDNCNFYGNNIYNIERVVSEAREQLENIYLDLCEKLKKQGYDEIEYQSSDEFIKEEINANNYEFTEDGNRF